MGDGGRIQRIAGGGAAALTLLFGAAQWVFYDRLGIRPDEVGLGTDEVLVQATVGMLAVVASLATLFAFGAAWNLVLLGVTDVSRTNRLRWGDIVAFAAACSIGVIHLFVEPVGGRLSIAVGAAGAVCYGWATRKRKETSVPAPWELAAAMAIAWIFAVFAGTLLAILLRGRLIRNDLLLVLVVTAGLDTIAAVVIGLPRRRPHVLGRIEPIGLGWAAAGLVVGLVALFTVVSAVDDAGTARRGGELTSAEHRLVGGPVKCVETVWTGGDPSPLPAPTRYLLHLGTGSADAVSTGRGTARYAYRRGTSYCCRSSHRSAAVLLRPAPCWRTWCSGRGRPAG